MSNRYALFLLGVIFAIFFWLWRTEEIRLQQGPGEQVFSSSGSIVTGTLLVSPYGVEDDIIMLLSETKYELDMRMYLLTSKEIMTVLKNLSLLGVDIDMVLENSVYGGSSKEWNKVTDTLEPLGTDIVSDEALGNNFVHAKTLLLDDRTYIISTANLSYTSFWKNREYRFVGSDPDIAKSLDILFEKDHAGEVIRHADIHPALLICPTNCRTKIVDALWNAQRSILIQAQYIQDDEIARVLRKKHLEGLDVRVLVGEYQEDGWIEGLGDAVLTMDATYLHAKNILIDTRQLIMGSMNLSTNALDNNREIGIVIDDPDVIEQFQKQFERDWKKEKE